MTDKKIIDIMKTALDDAKALNISVFEVSKLTSISDYMIIASGRSTRQVSSIADRIVEVAKENNLMPLGVEGKAQGEWVLVDLGDIIVHIMHPETREYYQLEKLWSSDGERAEVQQ